MIPGALSILLAFVVALSASHEDLAQQKPAKKTSAAAKPAGRRQTTPVTTDTAAFRIVDSAHLRTGVVGEVRMRPTKEIVDESNIPSAPLPGATIIVTDRDNKVLGKVKSDSSGRFYLQLQPGTHYFRPQPFPGRLFPHPLLARRMYVTKDEVLSVLIEYDTGIR